MTRDPNSYMQASAEALAETLASKNQDYAPTGEFSNFEKAAEIAKTSVQQVLLAQIAIKLTRIERLQVAQTERYGGPLNESLKDSFLDLAGYATIAHAYLKYSGEDSESDSPDETHAPRPYWLVPDGD